MSGQNIFNQLLCKAHNSSVGGICSLDDCKTPFLCSDCLFDHPKDHHTHLKMIDYFSINNIESKAEKFLHKWDPIVKRKATKYEEVQEILISHVKTLRKGLQDRLDNFETEMINVIRQIDSYGTQLLKVAEFQKVLSGCLQDFQEGLSLNSDRLRGFFNVHKNFDTSIKNKPNGLDNSALYANMLDQISSLLKDYNSSLDVFRFDAKSLFQKHLSGRLSLTNFDNPTSTRYLTASARPLQWAYSAINDTLFAASKKGIEIFNNSGSEIETIQPHSSWLAYVNEPNSFSCQWLNGLNNLFLWESKGVWYKYDPHTKFLSTKYDEYGGSLITFDYDVATSQLLQVKSTEAKVLSEAELRVFFTKFSYSASANNPFSAAKLINMDNHQSLLIIGSETGLVHFLKITKNEFIPLNVALTKSSSKITTISYWEDRKLVITGSQDGSLMGWKMHEDGFKPIKTLNLKGSVRSIEIISKLNIALLLVGDFSLRAISLIKFSSLSEKTFNRKVLSMCYADIREKLYISTEHALYTYAL